METQIDYFKVLFTYFLAERKRKRVDEAHTFIAELQKIPFKGSAFAFQFARYIQLPAEPLLLQTKRSRFHVEDTNTINIIHRDITHKILQFLIEKCGKTPAVYIHGPQGVGKSHSLFEVVCELRRDPINRVLYIPDCGGWAATSPMEFLVHAIITAFVDDQEVVDTCLKLELTENGLRNLLVFLPEYCARAKMRLMAIFDQHNGLSLEVIVYTVSESNSSLN